MERRENEFAYKRFISLLRVRDRKKIRKVFSCDYIDIILLALHKQEVCFFSFRLGRGDKLSEADRITEGVAKFIAERRGYKNYVSVRLDYTKDILPHEMLFSKNELSTYAYSVVVTYV